MRQALGTGLVGAKWRWVTLRASKAGKWRSRVCGPSFEDIRVRASHDIRHHCAGGSAHDEDAGCVGIVLGEGVVDHADDAQRVTRPAVRERPGVVDVPAVAVFCGLGVDEDVAEGVGVGREFGGTVPVGCAAAAPVELQA